MDMSYKESLAIKTTNVRNVQQFVKILNAFPTEKLMSFYLLRILVGCCVYIAFHAFYQPLESMYLLTGNLSALEQVLMVGGGRGGGEYMPRLGKYRMLEELGGTVKAKGVSQCLGQDLALGLKGKREVYSILQYRGRWRWG